MVGETPNEAGSLAGAPPFATPLRCVEYVAAAACDNGLRLRASKTISDKDPYLSGHFPHFTIFPGVFVIESLRQMIVASLGERHGVIPDIATLRSVRFMAPLLPGDVMTLEATVGSISTDGSFEVDARCLRNETVPAARLKVEFRYGGLS